MDGCCGVLAVGAVERIVPAVAVAAGSEGTLHVHMVAQLVRRCIAENYEEKFEIINTKFKINHRRSMLFPFFDILIVLACAFLTSMLGTQINYVQNDRDLS